MRVRFAGGRRHEVARALNFRLREHSEEIGQADDRDAEFLPELALCENDSLHLLFSENALLSCLHGHSHLKAEKLFLLKFLPGDVLSAFHVPCLACFD